MIGDFLTVINIKKIFNDSEYRLVAINICLSILFKGGSLILSLFNTRLYILYFGNDTILGGWYAILSILNWILYFDLGIGNGIRNKIVVPLERKDYSVVKKYVSTGYVVIGVISGAIIVVGSFETSAYVENFGGTIYGNGYTITEQNGNALIGELTGSVDKLCVKNAKIANDNNGSYTNCAVISGGITGYVGNTGVSYSSLPELAVAMSGVFGVDMTSSNVVLLPVTQNYKVYEYLYYAVDSKTVASKGYLNSRNGAGNILRHHASKRINHVEQSHHIL